MNRNHVKKRSNNKKKMSLDYGSKERKTTYKFIT